MRRVTAFLPVVAVILLVVAAAGCGSTSTTDTGARAAFKQYADLLAGEDYSGAYTMHSAAFAQSYPFETWQSAQTSFWRAGVVIIESAEEGDTAWVRYQDNLSGDENLKALLVRENGVWKISGFATQ